MNVLSFQAARRLCLALPVAVNHPEWETGGRAAAMTGLDELRDDSLVQSAIIQRLDGTVQGLVGKIRVTHARDRPDPRVAAKYCL